MVNGLKDNKNGFTLIEVIAGITLTLMLLLIMSSFIFNTIKCYKEMKKINLQDEYLKESVICINKNLQNSNEVIVKKDSIDIKKNNNEINITLNNSQELIAEYCKLNKKEIIASDISYVNFHKKNNLIYLYIKNRNGGEIMCSLPLNRI